MLSTMADFAKKNKIKIIIILFSSIFISFLCTQFLSNGISNLTDFFSIKYKGLFIARFELFFIFSLFLGLHWLFPIKELYNWIFNKRYWVALIFLFFMVINQFHGSSIACFDQTIQPGQGSEFVEPVLGVPRGIRSDEWLASTPNRLSTQFGDDPYTKYSYVMRGTKTLNTILSVNMFCNYSALAYPFSFAVFLFGQTYGQSVMWYSVPILTFLVSLEMCMIISRKNKLVSVMGATLIVFSGYYQWWSFSSWVLGAQASIVCGYHFIQTNKKSVRFLLGIGLGLSIAFFVGNLYPAWQVPAGYLFLGILLWILYENISKIKKLDKLDWLILIGSFIFAASIILMFMYMNREYTECIMNTVYPGQRVSSGGESGAINKLFWWLYNPLFSFPNKTFNNPSEAGALMTFFPIPLIMAFWYLIKEKKKDFFVIMIIVVSLFLGSYIMIGWPEILAKITLMSNTIPKRAVDILMFSQIYLLVAVLTRFENCKKIPAFWVSFTIGIILPVYILINLEKFPEVGVPIKYIIFISCFLCVCFFGIMTKTSKKFKNGIIIGITTVAFCTGAFVHPIQKGFDAIYSKPLAREIMNITESNQHQKWVFLGRSIIPQQFLIACGAPTINSVNLMPNMDLWSKLDPTKKYNDVYNRYAHVQVEFTFDETSFELITTDTFLLHLSYKDIPKTEISYVYSNEEIESNEYVLFEKIYEEGDSLIYKIKNY